MTSRFLDISCGTRLYSMMQKFKLSLSILLFFGLTSVLPVQADETTVTAMYGPTYKATQIPNNKTNHGVNIGILNTSISRSDTLSLGENYFLFGAGQEDKNDPAQRSTHGALLLYLSEHFLLSGNTLADRPLFEYGALRDIRLEVGGEFASHNNGLQTRRKALLIGPNFKFDLFGEGSSLNVGLHYVKEWNNNGIFRRAVSYKPTFETVFVARQPLPIGGLPLRFEGLLNVTLPKGEDGFHAKTATSVLSQSRLVMDVGQLMFHRPRILDSFIGFQYWFNKTGDDHVIKSGAVEETVFFGSSVHF